MPPHMQYVTRNTHMCTSTHTFPSETEKKKKGCLLHNNMVDIPLNKASQTEVQARCGFIYMEPESVDSRD